jgi:hypothetical protein
MTVEIVKIHGKVFTRFLPSDDTIEASEAHCTSQTCGTVDGIIPAEIEYRHISHEESQASVPYGAVYWKEWWEGPAGKCERRYRRDRKIERERRIAAFDKEQTEILMARKRLWAKDAMRCGLPNPFPQAFE